MSEDFKGAQQGAMRDEVKQAIIQLGLDYRLMTQFTSFVAVEEMIVTDGGQPRRIDVPVEVPEGVNRAAVFGQEGDARSSAMNSRMISGLYLSPNVMASAQSVVVTRSGSNSEKAKAPRASRSSGAGGVGVSSSAPPPPKPARVAVMADEAIAVDGLRNLSPEEQKRAQLQSKFHPSVLAVIDRLKDSKLSPGVDEAKFIHDGKAEVQIWLTEKSAETLARLKELGFEVVLDPKTAKMVIGRLPIEKLAALAELKSVRYVAPQMTSN
jgi:Ca-activated chloride channel homolog